MREAFFAGQPSPAKGEKDLAAPDANENKTWRKRLAQRQELRGGYVL